MSVTAAPAGTAQGQRAVDAWLILALPSALLILTIVVAPSMWLFWLSLFEDDGRLGFGNYAQLVAGTALRKTLVTTVVLSLAVTAIVAVLGYVVAYMLRSLTQRSANICLILVLLPFWTSTLVRTYAWLVLLQRRGVVNSALIDAGLIDTPIQLVNNMTGTIIGMVHVLLPYLILPLYAAMRSIPDEYVRAAGSLGASSHRAFWDVFFPLSLPGLIAGLLLVFVLSLGFYITPALLGGGRVIVWSMMIERTVSLNANWGAASALGVMLLVVTMLILLVVQRVFGVSRLMGR